MELRHLRYFVAVGEHLHFGRAAQALHISQPPLSRQIRSLEQEVGAELFARTSRRVQLTAAGETLLTEAKLLLQHADRLATRTREAALGARGRLAIGFISVADYNVLPGLLRAFRARFPQVVLSLREATTDLQLEALLRDELDVGIVLAPVADPRLAFRPLLREPLVAALAANDKALVSAKTLSVSALRERPFILFPRPLAPGLYDSIIGVCERAGFSPRVGQEAIQMQTIVSLVSVRMGVALVPRSLTNLKRTGVVYRPLEEKSPLVTTGVAWKNSNTSATLRALLGLIDEVYRPTRPGTQPRSRANSSQTRKR